MSDTKLLNRNTLPEPLVVVPLPEPEEIVFERIPAPELSARVAAISRKPRQPKPDTSAVDPSRYVTPEELSEHASQGALPRQLYFLPPPPRRSVGSVGVETKQQIALDTAPESVEYMEPPIEPIEIDPYEICACAVSALDTR